MPLTSVQESFATFLRSELQRLLIVNRLSRDQLGRRIGYSGEQVGKVLSGERNVTHSFAEAMDAGFATGGVYARMFDEGRRIHGTYPPWFKSWVDAEERASVVKWWEALLIPGLLQTPEYARTLFLAWQAAKSDEELEEMVAGRMARQAIFGREEPPKFYAVIDETVLHRPIGGQKIMHDQLLKLGELAEHPRMSIHVVPAQTGAHIGLLGAFAVADFNDNTPGIVYMESPGEGETTKHPATVAKITLTFDTLLSEALPRRASRELIMKVAEEIWT